MALYTYRFVSAQQTGNTGGPQKVWLVATVNGKQGNDHFQDLYEYSNRLGQEAWELVSDSIDGASRELVFRQVTN